MTVAPNAFATREEWLSAFTARAADVFDALAYTIPPNLRAPVGFSCKGARAKRIGECHSTGASGDGSFEIFIMPSLQEPRDVAATLTHEIIHAVVGLEAGHGKAFKRCATDLGLGGKMTATVPTDAWDSWANPILADLGPFPHVTLRTGGGKKQTTRLKKCECPECGFVFRTTEKWLQGVSWKPQCPDPECNGRVMRCEGED